MGHSVNDSIAPEVCSLQYASLDQAVAMVRSLGQGALLAKIDIQSAYRILPVHQDDRPLLGLSWEGFTYVDTTLPFGLRSAPKLFGAVADALLWAMHCNGIHNSIHYPDDFLFAGPPDSPQCMSNLEIALVSCSDLGVPVAPEKVVGPSSTITFLSIELDTVNLQLCLPEDKVSELRLIIRAWTSQSSKSYTKHQLLSLIGKLHHASSVVKPGRSFLRRLISLSCSVKPLNNNFCQIRFAVVGHVSQPMEWY